MDDKFEALSATTWWPRRSRLDRFLVQKLVPEAILPKRGTKWSAGLDLCVLLGDWIQPGETIRFGTGLAFSIPEGFEGHIHPRSSAFYRGLDLDGLIDSDYRGEVLLQIRNSTTEPIEISAGERVAQLVIRPVAWFEVEEVEELPKSERGTGGFGSTGK
jgi:dUTP pyrophosphatase